MVSWASLMAPGRELLTAWGNVLAAGLQRGAEAGLAALYGTVLQPSRAVRNAVLQALVRRFDAAASLHSKDAAELDIR